MHRLLLVLVIALAGCDYSETSSDVRAKYLDRHTDTFVFEGASRERVLKPLRELLAEHGTPIVDETPFADTLHTRPRPLPGGTTEYVVHFIKLQQRPAFVVHVMRISRDRDGEVLSSERDGELEWLLIQRADPDRALAIMNVANERADKVPAKTRRN